MRTLCDRNTTQTHARTFTTNAQTNNINSTQNANHRTIRSISIHDKHLRISKIVTRCCNLHEISKFIQLFSQYSPKNFSLKWWHGKAKAGIQNNFWQFLFTVAVQNVLFSVIF